MIKITIDHSYEDDYFMISYIEVNNTDENERERILDRFKEIDGAFVNPDNNLRERIADALGVDVNLIDLDTEEIDLM